MSQRPYVVMNMAMTADGKIATANRAVWSFGSARDHARLLELRATADAVMSGARTVDSNPVNLGPGGAKYQRLRLKRGLAEHNLRIVVSGSGTLNPKAEIFRRRFSPVIVLTTRRASARRSKALRAVADEVAAFGSREVDLRPALGWLWSNWGVKRLVCEGGAELNDALFRAGLVDELRLTICPKVFGGRTAPTIAGGLGMGGLAHAARMKLQSARRFGDELFLVYRTSEAARA